VTGGSDKTSPPEGDAEFDENEDRREGAAGEPLHPAAVNEMIAAIASAALSTAIIGPRGYRKSRLRCEWGRHGRVRFTRGQAVMNRLSTLVTLPAAM
jgi:hypothetical protein